MNSAPLIIRHPFAELGQTTSMFGMGIPNYSHILSLFLHIFGAYMYYTTHALIDGDQSYLETKDAEHVPKRRKLRLLSEAAAE